MVLSGSRFVLDCLVYIKMGIWRTIIIYLIDETFCAPLFLYNRVPDERELSNYLFMLEGDDFHIEEAEIENIVGPNIIYGM